MKRLHVCFLFSLSFVAMTTKVFADESAVQAFMAKYVETFNAGDTKALATMWAEDALHLDRSTGVRTEGRQAIAEDLVEAFQDVPGSKMSGRVEAVKMLTPEVARVEGEVAIGTADAEPSVVVFSALVVKKGDAWQLASVEESSLPQPASPADALAELEWLVGRWVDQFDGNRVDTSVRWSPNRAFLIRSFSSSSAEGETQQGTQVIGWDPRSKQIRSWSFNADGSFGDGIWVRDGETWIIRSTQTLSDGSAASGTYVLTQVDADSLTLQLIGHEVEGEPQPTSEPVAMVRAPEEAIPQEGPAQNAPTVRE